MDDGYLSFDDPDYEGMRLSEIEKIEGRKRIIEKCNFDMKVVRRFIKSKLSEGTNAKKYYKPYKDLLAKMLAEQESKSYSSNMTDEIKMKLAA